MFHFGEVKKLKIRSAAGEKLENTRYVHFFN